MFGLLDQSFVERIQDKFQLKVCFENQYLEKNNIGKKILKDTQKEINFFLKNAI